MIQNNLIRLQKGFLALMSVSLLFACSQVDTFEAEDMFALRSSAIAQEACYAGEVSLAVPFQGAYQNKQTVNLNVSNDSELVYLDFTSSTAILYINGERVNRKDGRHSFSMTHADFAATNTFEVRRTGEGHGACAPGNCLVLDASAYQIVEPCDAEDSCKGELETLQLGNKVTFTFTPCRDMQNAEIFMTTPQIATFDALDNKKWTNDSQNTLKWTGDLVQGQAITFEMEFTPECNAGNSNLVTNFIVKGEGNHLKDNLTIDCPSPSASNQANKGGKGGK